MPEAEKVRAMFAEISGRYDLLNHLLSFNLDRLWRRALVREGVKGAPRRVLDLATGTGDLAGLFRGRLPAARVVGADFCVPMMREGKRAGKDGWDWVAADALSLPFAAGAFEVVSLAFGLRNFSDPQAALREIRRVLAPAGRLLVLEFSMDLAPVFGGAYRFYFRSVLPRVGKWVSGSDAYRYLNRSVEELPPPERVVSWIREAGFASVRTRRLAGGSVMLYVAGTANEPAALPFAL